MKTFREMLNADYNEPLRVILKIQENLTTYAKKLNLKDFSCRPDTEKTYVDMGRYHGLIPTGDNSEIEISFLPAGVNQYSKFSKIMTMYGAYSTGPRFEHRGGFLQITETWKF